MIYNLTSVKRVITKVFSDLNLQEETHRVYDMIEWAGEALEKIGAFPSLEVFITGKNGEPLLEIENYQAQLPIGLHSVIQVAYSKDREGPFRPMRTSTNNFDLVKGFTTLQYGLNNLDLQYVSTDETPSLGLNFTDDLTYVITPGYIKTNLKEGYLMMVYARIPINEEGYPMIPDHVSFMEAIYWYINLKLLYPQWKSGQIRDAVYYDARSSWNFYCRQAYGVSMMPNVDQLESIKNSWLRIVPELREHNTFFSTLGQEQTIYNAN